MTGTGIGLCVAVTVGMITLLTLYPDEATSAGYIMSAVAIVYMLFSWGLTKTYRSLIDEGMHKILEEARKQTRNDHEANSMDKL